MSYVSHGTLLRSLKYRKTNHQCRCLNPTYGLRPGRENNNVNNNYTSSAYSVLDKLEPLAFRYLLYIGDLYYHLLLETLACNICPYLDV